MLEAFLFALSCSLDSFVASIAYGANKVKIPFLSIQILNLISTSILALSIFCGAMVRNILPGNGALIISFATLGSLGLFYLLQGISKTYISKNQGLVKKYIFTLFDLTFVTNIYINQIKNDLINVEKISLKEILYLGVALSIDAVVLGFASALGSINLKLVVLFSLITNSVFIWFGLLIGRKFAEKSKINLSWLSGIILICLAIIKLI